MIGLHSQLINIDEKMILKDALFLYVSDLQKRYYADKLVETDVYLAKMKEVETIVEKLHLTELYR
ncbi:hypothetical protein CMO86_10055 [Candidatus Woesearchaeota archaeon]|jgi:succinylarginine dihydrolase|nr:hypothetical protein [Candidatus Woesearchaeota archaeon]|tara:strand:+ start:1623 stop:1817 length:195 start_codon:yes stop_codon:yes gene_type:complete